MATKAIYCSLFFFNIARTTIPITEPTTNDIKYPRGLLITGNTKIPPWGALNAHPKNIDNAPAVADPTTQAGITLSGSAAANGIAPSVMNDNPIT